MNKVTALFCLLLGTTAFAQESAIVIPQAENQMSVNSDIQVPHETNWRLQIGQSNIGDGGVITGKGITIGAAYDFNSLFGIGGTYANMKIKRSYDYVGYIYDETSNANVFTGFGEITPIKYSIGKFDLTGSILIGAMDYEEKDGISEAKFFYGAGVGVKFNKQIGLTADTKVSPDLNTIDTLSLVGYY